jgi:casein kinase I family protein HRR25
MIIANKYEVMEKIGEGNFGKIYKGKNIRTGENVAIKVESIESDTKLLKNETKIYQYLSSGEGVPQVKWFGVDERNNYMVVTLLGKSLSDLKKVHKNFSLRVVLQIGKQILERLQFVHGKGLIHRDIKPDNFLLGVNNKLFIIDFGLCKMYIKNEKHVESKKLNKIVGTPTFISVNIHNLCEPSRRDDLESMIYVLVYLYFEELTWSKFPDIETIKVKKIELLENINVPLQIKSALLYIKNLKFEENPDYDYLFKLFELKESHL